MTLDIILNKYRILGKKGEGTFSEVLKCQNVKEGTHHACKKLKQRYESIEQVNNLREIQAMRRLMQHPNILELQEVVFDKKSGSLMLICELMDMNIYELIRGRRHYLQDKRIKVLMYQLMKSLDFMHRNGIFHRDVKPENILIKDDLLKLADFGSCRSVYSKQPYTEYISTRWYRAPECLLTDGYYSYKMDIWSVGCVLFEVLSLHPLFPGANEVDQISKIHDVLGTPDPAVLNKLRNKTRGMNFNFPTKRGSGIEKMLPHASQDCIDLIYKLCTYDPDERISAKQALRHPYFKELRDEEKRAVLLARKKQQQQNLESIDGAPSIVDGGSSVGGDKVAQKENNSESPVLADSKRAEAPPPEAHQATAAKSVAARYPATLLQAHKDPVYMYHKRERERRKKQQRLQRRMAESGPSPVNGPSFFPKITTEKPNTYQPTFQTSTYRTVPKVGTTSSTTTTTLLPTLAQAFTKPAKESKASKNIMNGHFQFPSVTKRGTGY